MLPIRCEAVLGTGGGVTGGRRSSLLACSPRARSAPPFGTGIVLYKQKMDTSPKDPSGFSPSRESSASAQSSITGTRSSFARHRAACMSCGNPA